MPLIVNLTSLKSLFFTCADGGRGQTLVELKDEIMGLEAIFQRLFTSASPSASMTASEFAAFIESTGTDLDESAVKSQFFESVSYPDDEDDVEEVAAIRADLGQFVCAIVRVVNSYLMQEQGESDQGR
jgi:hypothetical protein